MRRLFSIMTILAAFALQTNAGSHRALIFGLGKQKDTSWGKIHGDNDVYYVEQMLRTIGYTDIQTLKNEKATKGAMVKAFNDLAARCRKGDIVYIHYSGHGQLMTDLDGDEAERWEGKKHSQWDGSWVPYDAYMHYCNEDRGEKHLSDDEIGVLLTNIRNKVGSNGQIVVVVDACHSGDATRGEDEECVRGIDVKFNIPMPMEQTKGTPIKEQWLTISACKPYELCMEMKDLNVGKLTYALCSLGAQIFNMNNSKLESALKEYLEMYKGRLPQTPMVSGKK